MILILCVNINIGSLMAKAGTYAFIYYKCTHSRLYKKARTPKGISVEATEVIQLRRKSERSIIAQKVSIKPFCRDNTSVNKDVVHSSINTREKGDYVERDKMHDLFRYRGC